MQSDTKVSRVITIVPCGKHGAPRGNPCWTIASITGTNSPSSGICNDRARRAGMVGRISRKSIERGTVPVEKYTKTTSQGALKNAVDKVKKTTTGAAQAFRGNHKDRVGQH